MTPNLGSDTENSIIVGIFFVNNQQHKTLTHAKIKCKTLLWVIQGQPQMISYMKTFLIRKNFNNTTQDEMIKNKVEK